MNRDDATVAQAGGFIVQLLPFASDETLAKLEENIRNLDSVTTMLSDGLTPEGILEKLLDGLDVEFTDTIPVRYHCNCDRERIEKALISIGRDELQSMIDDGKPITMNCHFCNTDYTFSTDELKELLKSVKK